MKALKVVLNVIAIVLLLSTAICGLWLRSQGASVDASSRDFHMMIGLASVVVAILAAGVGVFGKTERVRLPAVEGVAEDSRASSPSDAPLVRSAVKGR